MSNVRLLDRHFEADGQYGNENSKAFGSIASAMDFIRKDIIKYLTDLRIIKVADKIDPNYLHVMGWLNGQCTDDYFDMNDGYLNCDMNADDPDYATWNVSVKGGAYWCVWTLHTEEVIE